MIATLQQILEKSLERLGSTTMAYAPPLFAAAVIILGALAVAMLVRYLLMRVIRASRMDGFLAQSGVSSLLGSSGRLRAARLVAGAAFWAIVLAGVLSGISAFDTALATRIVEGTVLLLPKLVTAGLILLAGAWIGQFLGRSMLIWACNEDLPHPRKLAAAVRTAIVFAAVAAAADQLDFARNVFLAAFVLLLGGAVIAGAVAAGLAARAAIERHFRENTAAENGHERSLWNHL